MIGRMIQVTLVALIFLALMYVFMDCQTTLGNRGFYVGLWCQRPIAGSEVLVSASLSDMADWAGIGFSVGLR